MHKEIVEFLKKKPMRTSELLKLFEGRILSYTLHNHLKQLVKLGIIQTERTINKRYYGWPTGKPLPEFIGKGRGFASMNPEKRREIASQGGKRAQALGTAHQFTSEEAKRAGQKGGLASPKRNLKGVSK